MSDLWNHDPFSDTGSNRRDALNRSLWEEEERIAQELLLLQQAREQIRMEGQRSSEWLQGTRGEDFLVHYAPQQELDRVQLPELDAYDMDHEQEKPRRHGAKKKNVFWKRRHTKRGEKAREETPVSAWIARVHEKTPLWARIASASFAVLIVLAAFVLAPFLGAGSEPVIRKGVTIDGVDVSGMTGEEATNKLRRMLDEKLAGTMITLTHAGQKWTLDNIALGLGDDLDATVERALSIRPPRRLGDRIAEWFKKDDEARSLHTSVTVSEVILRSTLAQQCGVVDELVVEGSVSFDPSADGAQRLFTITAPRTGRMIDMTHLVADVRNAVYQGGVHEIAVRVIAAYPSYTLSELKQSVSCVAEVSVSLDDASQTQQKNARLAAARLNGLMVQAGQTLFFNDEAAPYSGENGYAMVKDEETGVYRAPGTEYAATLLYRAGLLANMRPISRSAPETPLDHSAVGLDACVSDTKDLAIKNVSDYPVYVHAAVRDGALYIALYGMPLADSARVSIQTQVQFYTDAPQARKIVDETGEYGLAPGQEYELSPSHVGCNVNVYRVYIDKFGNESGRELISNDTYAPVAGTIVTGAQ